MLLSELAEALANCMKPPQCKPCDRFAQWAIGGVEHGYGTKRLIKASRGVVICAGGFGANYSMVMEHCPHYKDCMSLGTLADDGSGIRLGLSVGGSVTGMKYGSAWKFTYPPEAFLKTVQVGTDGTRLGNEDVYGARLTNNMVKAGGEAWLVMDSKVWNEARCDMSTSNTFVIFQKIFCWLNLHVNRQKADDLEALALKCGLPEKALRNTIERYNALCDKGEDTEFRKASKFLSPMRAAPYYAIKFSNARTLWFTPFLTLGGLRVEFSTGRLLDEGGNPIEGVYAAGRSASGIPATSYVSGLSIADAVFAGRRAARHAAGMPSGLPEFSGVKSNGLNGNNGLNGQNGHKRSRDS
jgi:3-oxo-5alpha-steroid 4-dehydrogenase